MAMVHSATKAILVFLVALSAVLVTSALPARAQPFGGGATGGGGAGGGFASGAGTAALGFGPFGGPIIGMRPGSNCIHITVGPPRSGDFVYVPGLSLLYSFYSIRPGAYVLGFAGPDVFCLFGRRAGFTGPLIIIMGTSL